MNIVSLSANIENGTAETGNDIFVYVRKHDDHYEYTESADGVFQTHMAPTLELLLKEVGHMLFASAVVKQAMSKAA